MPVHSKHCLGVPNVRVSHAVPAADSGKPCAICGTLVACMVTVRWERLLNGAITWEWAVLPMCGKCADATSGYAGVALGDQLHAVARDLTHRTGYCGYYISQLDVGVGADWVSEHKNYAPQWADVHEPDCFDDQAADDYDDADDDSE